jgi:hypothetical protein
MTPDEILARMRTEFTLGRGTRKKPRRYVGGLLVSFCDFLKELGTPSADLKSLDDLFASYPQITEGVSTLTLRLPDGNQKTIRPAYERAHRYFIYEHKRLDYPRSGPYATGKWADYRLWLDAMVTFNESDLSHIADVTRAFVLSQLPEHAFDPTTVRVEPPIFRILLEDFPFGSRAKGETTGAAFQAAIFGYIRADAPHLQVEARKVRAGSARTAGIGDIDAWEGDQLVISAEVKSFVVDARIAEELDYFSSEIQQRGALGLMVAEDFREGAREVLEEIGLIPVSRTDLVRIVSLWDPVKQRAALNAFQFVVVHREQNRPLIRRVEDFLDQLGYGLRSLPSALPATHRRRPLMSS